MFLNKSETCTLCFWLSREFIVDQKFCIFFSYVFKIHICDILVDNPVDKEQLGSRKSKYTADIQQILN